MLPLGVWGENIKDQHLLLSTCLEISSIVDKYIIFLWSIKVFRELTFDSEGKFISIDDQWSVEITCAPTMIELVLSPILPVRLRHMVRSPDSGLKSPARMSSPHRMSDTEQQPPGKTSVTGNDLLASLAIEKMGQTDSEFIQIRVALSCLSGGTKLIESKRACWNCWIKPHPFALFSHLIV